MQHDNKGEEKPLTYEDLCSIWEKNPECTADDNLKKEDNIKTHSLNKQEIARKFEEILENLKKLLSEREDSEKK